MSITEEKGLGKKMRFVENQGRGLKQAFFSVAVTKPIWNYFYNKVLYTGFF